MWLTSSPPHFFRMKQLIAPTLQLCTVLQCWAERQAYNGSWKALTPSSLESAALPVGWIHTTFLSPGLSLSSSPHISSGNTIGMTACSQGFREKKPSGQHSPQKAGKGTHLQRGGLATAVSVYNQATEPKFFQGGLPHHHCSLRSVCLKTLLSMVGTQPSHGVPWGAAWRAGLAMDSGLHLPPGAATKCHYSYHCIFKDWIRAKTLKNVLSIPWKAFFCRKKK